MSGTSADGVDAALVRITATGRAGRNARPGAKPGTKPGATPDEGGTPRVTTLAALTLPYERPLRARLLALPEVSARELADLHVTLADRLGAAALAVLSHARVRPEDVAFVASHGHTAFHRPPSSLGGRGRAKRRVLPVSLQIGDPSRIAQATGLDVVADFRARDVAAGGEGAPLVPFADRILFGRPGEVVACQNLGGIANVTALGPGPDDLVAFDTGPGMMLLDLAIARVTRGRVRYDADGKEAARGRVDEARVAAWLKAPWFRRPPPKSTGREAFGAHHLDARLRGWRAPALPDVLATLSAYTARSIADAYRRFLPPVSRCVVSGGGARHATVLAHLRAALPGTEVVASDALGVAADFKEAVAFALLGWAFRRGLPNTVPAATGAPHAVVGGVFVPGRVRRAVPASDEAGT